MREFRIEGFEDTSHKPAEYRLIAAVIWRAVIDATNQEPTIYVRQHDTRNALFWLNSYEFEEYSFEWCCAVIADDKSGKSLAELIRKGVQQVREGKAFLTDSNVERKW